MVLQIFDLVVIGLLYMAYPDGCRPRFTFPAEAKAPPRPFGVANAPEQSMLSRPVHKPSLTVPPQLCISQCVKQWSVREAVVSQGFYSRWGWLAHSTKLIKASKDNACLVSSSKVVRRCPEVSALSFLLKAHQHCLQQCCSYPWTRWSCSCSFRQVGHLFSVSVHMQGSS